MKFYLFINFFIITLTPLFVLANDTELTPQEIRTKVVLDAEEMAKIKIKAFDQLVQSNDFSAFDPGNWLGTSPTPMSTLSRNPVSTASSRPMTWSPVRSSW